jgi:hypothetical protein
MHGTQYHTDITRHKPYTTQEIKILISLINSKVKYLEPFTQRNLLGVNKK